MESDDDHHQPTSEKPVIDGEDDEQSGSDHQVTTKSYECNFCKRGFSNAQALGGHMNIHRKDKAKLKQSSTQTQPSLDIHHHNVPPVRNWPGDIVSSQQDHYASSRDESAHDIIHRRHLPLFAESPTTTTTTTTTTTSGETQKPEGQILGEVNTERALSSGQGSSSELDLELRLGPDPQDSSAPSATGNTRKFF